MTRARPRLVLLAAATVALACGDSGGPAGSPRVSVTPVLDSIFVGDTLPPASWAVTYIDAAGDTLPTGPVSWSSGSPAVATVDPATGRAVGVGPGEAVIFAVANGVTGAALLVVSRPLTVALLLDTLYLMPGDTITVPVAILRRGAPPPAPRFTPSLNPAIYTVDTVTGLLTAVSPGGPVRFVVRADTAADTGAVEVRLPADTSPGRGYFTALGTVIRRSGAQARAVNYRRAGDSVAFRVNLGIPTTGGAIENVIVTLRDSLGAAGVFAIDSLSPAEAFGADPICLPPRPWALWSTRTTNPTLTALSRRGGTLTITQVRTVTGGRAISGRFVFDAQRADFYDDPLGRLPLRGTFVAPLVSDTRPCR